MLAILFGLQCVLKVWIYTWWYGSGTSLHMVVVPFINVTLGARTKCVIHWREPWYMYTPTDIFLLKNWGKTGQQNVKSKFSILLFKIQLISAKWHPSINWKCLQILMNIDCFHTWAKVSNLNYRYHSNCAIWIIIGMMVFWTVCTCKFISRCVIWIVQFEWSFEWQYFGPCVHTQNYIAMRDLNCAFQMTVRTII